jgi:hypothetical protein
MLVAATNAALRRWLLVTTSLQLLYRKRHIRPARSVCQFVKSTVRGGRSKALRPPITLGSAGVEPGMRSAAAVNWWPLPAHRLTWLQDRLTLSIIWESSLNVSGSPFTPAPCCGIMAHPLAEIHALQAPQFEPEPTKQREPPTGLIQALDITGGTAVQQSQVSPSPLPLNEAEMKAEVKGSEARPHRKASLVSRACKTLL